jgi:O-antigen/teichoic acid export membrane protein
VINGVFLVGLNVLGLVKGFVVAAMLGAAVYGVWGLLTVAFATLFWLAAVGFDDKYLQQDRADQLAAFQVAFTLQAGLCAVFMAVVAVAIPLFGLLYGVPEIVWPGLTLGLTLPAIALQTPMWVHYRRMDFVRLRLLQAAEPVASLVATVALLAAGLEIWGLVLGTLAGSWVAAAVAVRSSPYPLAIRYEPGAVREYASFSWPLFVGAASGVLITQIPTAVAARTLGVTAVGAMALASNISQFGNRVDDVVTQTLYPAICMVKDRGDLLFEAFSTSNRLALLWAMPCGIGLALFAPDLVPLLLGEKWRFAVPVVQIFGGMAALNQVGFNWTAFFRARGETRPIAVANLVLLVVGLAVAVPLLVEEGVTGFAYGMTAATAAVVAVRLVYLTRIFPAFAMVRHIARGAAPTAVAAIAVLVLRAATEAVPPGAEIAGFVIVGLAATVAFEHSLLREVVGYLRR